jgi:hypothetical protein
MSTVRADQAIRQREALLAAAQSQRASLQGERARLEARLPQVESELAAASQRLTMAQIEHKFSKEFNGPLPSVAAMAEQVPSSGPSSPPSYHDRGAIVWQLRGRRRGG